MAKKFDYFAAFTQAADIALQQANLLKNVVDAYDANTLHEKIEEMHDLERQADTVRHELLNSLMKEFLPPFDHEDINVLVDRLDTVCDTIDDILMKFYMYNITEMRNDVSATCQGIIDCVAEVVNLTKEVRNLKKPEGLFDHISKINDVEELGDKFYIESTRNLYIQNDAMEITRWHALYDGLEDCYDSCEEVADIMESIILKNS